MDVLVLVWRVRVALRQDVGLPGTALIDCYYQGHSVVVPCDWRTAWELNQALADHAGEPVVATVPMWAVSPEMPAPGYDAQTRPLVP